MNIKYFIGPMSKNVVDAVIEYSKETENKINLMTEERDILDKTINVIKNLKSI